MKRIITLIITAFYAILMHAGMSNSIEYGQLFIVGDATETSWDLISAAEMSKIADGVFEWTGSLAGGKEFKFMNTREPWHKHIVAIENNVIAEVGKNYPLCFYSNWALNEDLDCKFKIEETGKYTITVDLTSMRMAIYRPSDTPKWPNNFYLVGSATDNQIIEIPDLYSVEHKKTIKLNRGFVKLIDTPTITAQTNSYSPRFPEVDIIFGQDCCAYLYSDSDNNNGWSVSVPGEYQIYLDNDRHTMLCKKYTQHKILYIVGGCCERAWNYWDDSNNSFRQDTENPDLMVWEGQLRIGWDKSIKQDGSYVTPVEPNKFKILTAQDWSRDTYHPYYEDALAEGYSDARISGGEDYKWTIKNDGIYRLELNTKTETLNVICIQNFDESNSSSPSTAEVEHIDISENTRHVYYYNLQGIRISQPVSDIYIMIENNAAKKCLKN